MRKRELKYTFCKVRLPNELISASVQTCLHVPAIAAICSVICDCSFHKPVAVTLLFLDCVVLLLLGDWMTSGTLAPGVFASPGSVLLHTGSVGLSLIAWVAAGLIALCGCLCYAELGIVHSYLLFAYNIVC